MLLHIPVLATKEFMVTASVSILVSYFFMYMYIYTVFVWKFRLPQERDPGFCEGTGKQHGQETKNRQDQEE